MSEAVKIHPHISTQDDEYQEHLTGRDRLVSNVIFSWAAHFVFIIAGFILPRMIDQRLGQELLGVWDFAWSLVSYFGLVQMGISSSVNRYVAKYRAVGDFSGMNGIVSSASCVFVVAGILVLGLAITTSLLLPQLFGARLGENLLEAQWVVFILGACLFIEISLSAFAGILTGCHRWDIHNIIKSGWHAATVIGMIVALLIGEGLRSLALITFVGLVLAGTTRIVLAHRVCENLQIHPSLIEWKKIRKLFFFGGKTLIPSVSNLLLNQTINILIVAFLGPAALALYARPKSLIRHIYTLVSKMAMILTPTTGSMQSCDNMEGIQELLIKSVRYSIYLVLPIVIVLVLFGGQILKFWMGPRYANNLVPAILAAGYLTTLVQLPVINILAGMNAHGRAGMAQFVASLCSVGLTFLTLGYLDWGIIGTAIVVTLPLTIINVVYLPSLICRKVKLDLGQYFFSVTEGPIVHIIPFMICLVIARLVFNTEPLVGLALGGTVGSAILAVLYWRYVIPSQIKKRLLRYAGMKRSVA